LKKKKRREGKEMKIEGRTKDKTVQDKGVRNNEM
jgi:hypothetical protein